MKDPTEPDWLPAEPVGTPTTRRPFDVSIEYTKFKVIDRDTGKELQWNGTEWVV